MTPQQLTTLKAAILAETDPAFVALRQANNEQGMANWYNGLTSPAWVAWRPVTATADILDAITWASLTPADAPDGSALALQREYRCQGKQLNLQILLQGRESVATGKLTVRQGLTDALTGLPAGAGGVAVDAGWLGAGKVKAAISRTVTRAERLYATGSGTAGTPGNMVFEGEVSAQNISDALRA